MSLVDSTSSPRRKSSQVAAGPLHPYHHGIHPSRGPWTAEPIGEIVTCSTIPLRDHLDPPIGEIPDPTGQAQRLRPGPGPVAEADPCTRPRTSATTRIDPPVASGTAAPIRPSRSEPRVVPLHT
ncbi:hypothetical protein Asera_52370 [Actinocatenispora sera]|uniref:Uncharacterized protein n=1 Tax=Actinocatenispora sera TaxID=390989 RepID=A0A810L7J5_9ACTN|nr:hypothetical protein Asera_52370 [Actinocatenispora sera]